MSKPASLRHLRSCALSLCGALSLFACGSEEETIPASASDAMLTYANIVEASYADSLSSAELMNRDIQAFVAAPTQATFDAAKQAWLNSREPYLQTEVYRFYDGPIDNPTTGPEMMINAWPLDEAYIDYVEGNPNAGIINNPAQTIDAQVLMQLNEAGGEANIATGYHAIEFLLWGQDQNPAGPGTRAFTDYVPVDAGGRLHFDRRGQYLQTVSGLLVTHLQQLVQAWSPTVPNNYRAQFLAMTPAEQLKKALAGMIILSGFETGGERIRTALDSGDQEDEHSCFSDNTHRDMIQDIKGVQNVWLGTYTRTNQQIVTGVGIQTVVAARDAQLALRVTQSIETSYQLALALQPPFDQEIALTNPEGRARVKALEDALFVQKEALAEVFTLLGLEVPADPV